MPAVESMILCLCIAARACQRPRDPMAFWRGRVRSNTGYTGANATRHHNTPEHIVIKGSNVGYDGRLHLGVAVDANHLPAPSAKDLANTARATEEFEKSWHLLNAKTKANR